MSVFYIFKMVVPPGGYRFLIFFKRYQFYYSRFGNMAQTSTRLLQLAHTPRRQSSSFTKSSPHDVVLSAIAANPVSATTVRKKVSGSALNRMPERSWDSHMHVIGDPAQYPV